MRSIGRLCTCGNAFSRPVLMVVRLDTLPTPLKQKGRHPQVLCFLHNLAGDNSKEATPDPIPNSAVKLFCVDGTAWAAAWESRTSPAFFLPVRSRPSDVCAQAKPRVPRYALHPRLKRVAPPGLLFAPVKTCRPPGACLLAFLVPGVPRVPGGSFRSTPDYDMIRFQRACLRTTTN